METKKKSQVGRQQRSQTGSVPPSCFPGGRGGKEKGLILSFGGQIMVLQAILDYILHIPGSIQSSPRNI